MSRMKIMISMVAILFLISCEDQAEKNNAMTMNEITTENVG